jgi:endonuclease V-like protein UPF0215 family
LSPNYTVAGVQDGSFEAFHRGISSPQQYTALCCATLKGEIIVGISIDRILVDGLDSTMVLLNNLGKTDTEAIILGGVTFGGFNVVDVEYVYERTGIPVIVYSGFFPDMDATKNALRKHFSDWKIRWKRYEKLGEIYKFESGFFPPIFFEYFGCSREFAEKILMEQSITCRIPEAVRVADIVAKGVSSVFQNQGEYSDDSLG